MYDLHFAVPMAGALLYTLKIRHDLAMVSTLLKHLGAKLIFVDYQFLDVAKGALEIISKSIATVPQLVLIPDSEKLSIGPKLEIMEYDALLAMGNLDFLEWKLFRMYDDKMEELMEEAYEKYLTKKEGTRYKTEKTDEEKAH
ncbi:hypothetical protein Tco_1399333 [Tanacetum coccineum]